MGIKSSVNILPFELFSGSSTHLNQGFSPSVVRFFMLQAHYGGVLDFSNDALVASEKGFRKLLTALEILNNHSFEYPYLENRHDIGIFYDFTYQTEKIMERCGMKPFDKIILSYKKISPIKIMLPQTKRLGYTVKVHQYLLIYEKK